MSSSKSWHLDNLKAESTKIFDNRAFHIGIKITQIQMILKLKELPEKLNWSDNDI